MSLALGERILHSYTVELGPRRYDILIGAGILAQLGELLLPVVPDRRVGLVTNWTVARLFLPKVLHALTVAGYEVVPVILPDGEETKSWSTLQTVYDALVANRMERTSALLALGVGVIGDLTGFVAATYLRGVPCVQIPTTLLAQVDSSVGGKTGINHSSGKNLIGAFHQPVRVIIDLDTLASLPHRQFLSGMAEVIKYGIIRSSRLFATLEERLPRILALENGPTAAMIGACCAIKAGIVAEDEREGGVRALLNLGHTFGHAIEILTNYQWLHGEGVAAGMVLAAALSGRISLCDRETVARIRQLLVRTGLPVVAPSFSPERYREVMEHDKKVQGGRIRFVLVEEIGRARCGETVPFETVAEILAEP